MKNCTINNTFMTKEKLRGRKNWKMIVFITLLQCIQLPSVNIFLWIRRLICLFRVNSCPKVQNYMTPQALSIKLSKTTSLILQKHRAVS